MFSSVKDIPTPEKKIAELWVNNPEVLFEYQNLENYLGLATLDKDGSYFVVSNPEKKTRFSEYSAEGEYEREDKDLVIYIYIDREDFKKAFKLVAPFISKKCFNFKVSNLKKRNKYPRFDTNAQITFDFVDNNVVVITRKQIEEISNILSINNIKAGKKLHSDAQEISPYVFVRRKNEWDNNPEKIFIYENLENKSEYANIVKDGGWYFISSKKIESTDWYGWKLHISIDPEQVKKAFNLAAPIISRYCYNFKVISDMEKMKKDSRTYMGAQITIYLEDNGKPVITSEMAEEMIKEINQVFKDNNIRPGKKPDSDANTISEYFSIRNDKINFLLIHMADYESDNKYIPADIIGTNFNPFNDDNSFYEILSDEVKQPFDILQHFASFEAKEAKLMYLIVTLNAYIRNHISINNTDEIWDEFLLQCKGFGNELDNKFLKNAYQNNDEIKYSIKYAVFLITHIRLYEFSQKGIARSKNDEINTQFINSLNLSAQYLYDNSFKKLLINISECFKNDLMPYMLDIGRQPNAWVEQWTSVSQSKISFLPETTKECLIEIVKNGNFYDSLAALNYLRGYSSNDSNECSSEDSYEYSSEEYFKILQEKVEKSAVKYKLREIHQSNEYIKILQENVDKPAVQFKLGKIYQDKYNEYGLEFSIEKSENYFIKAMSSGYIFCQDKLESILKHRNIEEFQELDKSSSFFAAVTLCSIWVRVNSCEQKSMDLAIDHALVKQCLKKIETNPVYNSIYVPMNTLLKYLEQDRVQKKSFSF